MNINTGTGKVTLQGKNNLYGSKTVTFTIYKPNPAPTPDPVPPTPDPAPAPGPGSDAPIIEYPGEWNWDGNGWKFIHSDATYTKDGWEHIRGSWYLFDGVGYMRRGWNFINGYWYYFYNDGSMAKNTRIDGCRLSSSGAWQ